MSNWEYFISPEAVDFTEGWQNEADFDKWLVSPDGLTRLENETGIRIDPDSIRLQESVGGYYADIFALDNRESIDRQVVIENQRGTTNHDHLGKVLTYAGALATEPQGCFLVWIAERFRDEHRAAIDWLNLKTEGATNFFGIEIELERYGELLSPRLKPVCLPNDWSGNQRVIAHSATKGARKVYAEFWPKFANYMKQKNSPLKAYHSFSTGFDAAWTNYSTNRVFFPSIDLSIKYGVITVSLYVDGSLKDIFVDGHAIVDDIYKKYGDEINAALDKLAVNGVELKHAGRIHRSGRIQLALREVDIEDREKWPDYFKWIADTAEAIDKVLVPIAQEFSLDEFLMEKDEA